MLVKTFDSTAELQAYITAQSLTVAKIAAIYWDATSGKHVLVHVP